MIARVYQGCSGHPDDWYKSGDYGLYSWCGIVVGDPICGRFSDETVALIGEVRDHEEWEEIEKFDMAADYGRRLKTMDKTVGFKFEPQNGFFRTLGPLLDPITEKDYQFQLINKDRRVKICTYFGGLCKIVKVNPKAYVDDVVKAYESRCLEFLLSNHPVDILHPYTKVWKAKLEEMELGCDAPDEDDDTYNIGGGFGGVFKGKLLDDWLVAVKVMRESKGDGKDFINEVASISRTSHISDFGLAKLCSTKESYVSMLDARGTTGYIAPEVFSRNFGVVWHKSEISSGQGSCSTPNQDTDNNSGNYSIGGADTEDIDDVYHPDMTSPPLLEKQQHGTKVKKKNKLEELFEGNQGNTFDDLKNTTDGNNTLSATPLLPQSLDLSLPYPICPTFQGGGGGGRSLMQPSWLPDSVKVTEEEMVVVVLEEEVCFYYNHFCPLTEVVVSELGKDSGARIGSILL
ncbi:hypothetical protein GIB67_002947 [Kingdonia uniflora]|uniref:Uncharacterized protein n=1 Tax=Kingdonia uniflora TaxID=39325 RepID=A0A7J7LWD6_9MAGN|nr:hypothetical protein GIB67_005813 [Kingdonia uniflora]KAF6151248.1 hypothetical protein GIB67_002947 [Kingdonia uniflora]